jgi:Kre9/KNH-like N-terminal Ig-like domain
MKKLMWICVLVLFIAGLSGAASITVTKPALNEPWTKGQSYTITWTKIGTMPDKVRITLRDKASTTLVQEIMDDAPNTGAYLWAIPTSIPDGEYCIRVRVKTTDISDDSEVFTISASQQPQSPSFKSAKTTAAFKPYATPIKPYLEVVQPVGEASCRNGQHLFIHFEINTMPGDGIEIDFYNESGTKKIYDIYEGTYGGTSVPPAGPDYPRRYYYDWLVPFGNLFSPGYYKIRVHSVGKNLTAWSGRVYITWPMKEYEYYLEPAVATTYCVNDNTLNLPIAIRPKCEEYAKLDHAYVGIDVYRHTDRWRIAIDRSRLRFAIEQFQGKKVKLLDAKLILKRICTAADNSNVLSCASRLYRLDAPIPDPPAMNPRSSPCLSIPKTALMILPDDLTEKAVYVTQTVEHWINGTYPNYGFLLTVADETPTTPYTAVTCKSGYTAQLYVKIEEEYKGYEH